MASLVVSVISRFAAYPSRPDTQPDPTCNARLYQEPEAIFPAVLDDDERFAASRQAATIWSRASGLNGFCRLRTTPSFVAMVRKSGSVDGSEGTGRPEITTIWTDGC